MRNHPTACRATPFPDRSPPRFAATLRCRRPFGLLAAVCGLAVTAASGCGRVREAVRESQAIVASAADWARFDPGEAGWAVLSAEHSGVRLTLPEATELAGNPLVIFLRRLESLEPIPAAALATSEAALRFGALRSLSPRAAAALSSHRCALEIDCLREIDVLALDGLAEHAGHLSLNGLEEIDAAAAHALSRHRGFLSLNGVRTLSEEAARALAGHRGDLCLNGLESLSPAAAWALAGHGHGLFLGGLGAVDDEVLEALARHAGNQLTVGPTASLSGPRRTSAARLRMLRLLRPSGGGETAATPSSVSRVLGSERRRAPEEAGGTVRGNPAELAASRRGSRLSLGANAARRVNA